MNTIKQTLIDRSVPQYIKSEHPMFSLFLSAFYEYCESQGKSIDYINNLKSYRTLDTTIDEFIQYFTVEYINKFPNNILADKKLLINNIQKFYINKGNQESYKFLFRVLYNEDISFYFPGDDVLRSSDGKWTKRTIIKIKVNSIDSIKNKDNTFIVGKTSGAIAGIESIIVYTERSILIAEVDILYISGAFTSGELVTIDGVDFETVNCYTSTTITNAGSGYAIGDVIPIKNSLNTTIGLSSVSNTTRGSIASLSIVDGGVNYNGNIKVIDDFSYLPINYTWDSMILNDTPIYSSTGYDFSVQPINFTITEEDFDGVGDSISILDSSNSSGSGAYGVVESVDKLGQILTVSVIASGDQYETPTAIVESTTGSGAIISVLGGGGGIKKIRLDTLPAKYSTDTGIHLDCTNSGDGLATATLNNSITGEYPGFWLNEDGQLSSNKKLQDNYFYQDFSYVIKVSKSIEDWIDHIKDIIHPLGTKVFGEIEILSSSPIGISVDSITTNFVFNFDINVSIGIELFDLAITTSVETTTQWSDGNIVQWGDTTDVTWSG